MQNELLIKNFIADGAVGANLIVKPGSADGKVALASAATDLLIGVTTSVPADSGARCDVILAGIVEIIAGGNITRGNPVTADSAAKAVVANPAATVNNRIVGIALESAAAGDYVSVLLGGGYIQGAGTGV